MKLTHIQTQALIQLKRDKGWMAAGEIAKAMIRIGKIRDVRGGALGGPLSTLAKLGLVVSEKRQRKQGMRLRTGQVIFQSYHVFKATEKAYEFELEGEQKEFCL